MKHIFLLAYGLMICSPHVATCEQSEDAKVAVTMSGPKTNSVGSVLVLTVIITNISSEPVLIRKLDSPWEWLTFYNSDGSKSPTTTVPDIKVGVDTDASFIVLKPRESVETKKVCNWVTDAHQRAKIKPGISSNLHILDCGSYYVFLTSGGHSIIFLKRSPKATNFKSNERWINIKEHFGRDLFVEELQTSPMEVQVVSR